MVWNGEVEECIHQNHIFRIRVTSPLLHPVFLSWLIGSQRGKRYFLRAAKQTTGIASINKGQLGRFPLLVPPIGLQRRFADRLQRLDDLRSTLLSASEETVALFASLQHRAFNGEL